MAIKDELLAALEQQKKRAEQSSGSKEARKANLITTNDAFIDSIKADLAGIPDLQITVAPSIETFEDDFIDLKYLNIELAGQKVTFTPEVNDGKLVFEVRDFHPRHSNLRVKEENGRWIAYIGNNSKVADFDVNYYGPILIDLVNRS